MILFSTSYNYGKKVASAPHQILRAHVIRVPGHAVTLFPRDYMETTVPDDISDTSLALEPRYDNKHPHWPQPEVTKSIGGITRVPNLTAEPTRTDRTSFTGLLTKEAKTPNCSCC